MTDNRGIKNQDFVGSAKVEDSVKSRELYALSFLM